MRTWKQAGQRVAWAIALVVLASCGGNPQQGAQTGSVALQVVLAQALSGADIQRVTIAIRGSGIAPPLTSELVKAGSAWQGTVTDIPAGTDRIVDAQALDATGTVRYQGSSAPLSIGAGATVEVLLTLQQVDTPPPYENEPPRITSLVASANTVRPSGTLTLVATAMDPNGDALSYSWTASAGAFSTASQPSTSWTAPTTEGLQQLHLEVTDARGSSTSVSFEVSVQKDGSTGSAHVTVGFNTWPEIRAMNALPTTLAIGQAVQLSASTVDADGDALAYLWSSECAGTFSNVAVAMPSFTLTSAPSSGRCRFQLQVSDGRGGQQLGGLVLQVGAAVSVNVAPQVDSVSQTLTQADGGQKVTLSLTAHDPEGHTVSFSWSATSGSIQATRWTSSSGEADWVAPACFDTAVSITASVTDADGARTQRVFSVSPSDSAKCGALAVTGLRQARHVLQDGSVLALPEDPTLQTFGAWVPTADGTGYVFHAGLGQADGSFVIRGVDRTPYLLQLGASYVWTSTRVLDLSYLTLGRPDLELEPSGFQFGLSVDGLAPWQPYADDLEVHSPGAGIGYLSRSCASEYTDPDPGATSLSDTFDYPSFLTNCGNPAARIDPSKGDVTTLTQNVYRQDTSTLASGLDVQEARRATQLAVSSSASALLLSGTLSTLPLTSRTVDFRASQFDAQALAAHPLARLDVESVGISALAHSVENGLYAGSADLAVAYNYTPGQGDYLVTFQYGSPFPSDWSRLLVVSASSSVPLSVPLPGGGSSKSTYFSGGGSYSQRLLDVTSGTQVIEARVGAPSEPRVNGVVSTSHLTGVGLNPLLSWKAPTLGTPTGYQVRLYEIRGTSTSTTRTLVGGLTTPEPQLRLPSVLVSGKNYFAVVRAISVAGHQESQPFIDGSSYDYAGIFSSTFSP